MSQFKDFQGKTLDEAIKEACEYYGVEREKLEIEILSDAKSGIFGLVGAKKASIRAARVQLGEAVSSLMGEPHEDQASPASKKKTKRESSDKGRIANPETGRSSRAAGGRNTQREPSPKEPAHTKESEAPGKSTARGASKLVSEPENRQRGRASAREKTGRKAEVEEQPASISDARKNVSHDTELSGRQGERAKPDARGTASSAGQDESPVAYDGALFAEQELPDALSQQIESVREDMPEFDLANCDSSSLAEDVEQIVLRLVEPIVGRVPCRIEVGKDRVRAFLDCGDASGLLVGRDGQTLASVQYLASRIIARKIGGSLRLHIDAGNYRERQDDRLKELAQSLAQRVKKTRRPQSTRPLSAYQRRIVHLALEHDPEVTTHSKGEGTQRRVVVHLRGNMEQAKNGRKRSSSADAPAGPIEPEES